MLRVLPVLTLFLVGTGVAATAAAQKPAPKPAPPSDPDADGDDAGKLEPEEVAPHAQFTFAFAGGALFPQGSMTRETQPGLDVWGRVGWTTPSGLGLVMHLEYAPLRRSNESAATDEVVDAHLFAATAGPRYTLGRHLVRVWLAGGAGIVVERVQTTQADQSSVVAVESALGVSGGGGLDLCFLGSGGITLAGAYTRGLSSGAEQDYVSVNAGLVFVY
jgi:hypothetical protein